LWGHLFGGRYKSVAVEENERLAVLIDYVHLDPWRAGLADVKEGLETYRWSSLPDYVKPPGRRSGGAKVKVATGLAQRGYADKAPDRRRYLEHLEAIARDQAGIPAAPGGGERTLQSTLRRGWYFGGDAFRERLLGTLGRGGAAGEDAAKPRYRRESGYVGEQMRDHGIGEAERMLGAGLALAGLEPGGLKTLRKGDWRNRVIGRLIRKRTIARADWIAERLCMGVSTRAGRLAARDPDGPEWGPEWRRARKLLRGLEAEHEKAGNLD